MSKREYPPKIKAHLKFLDEAEKRLPGFKDHFLECVKDIIGETESMSIIEFFTYHEKMSKTKTNGLLNVRSNLWNYLYDNHGLTLVESEINDILELARQEIELPDDDEINKGAHELLDVGEPASSQTTIIWKMGVLWGLNKVRNPYPKQINP